MNKKAILALLFGISGAVFASDWRALNDEARNYYVQGQYEKSAAKSKEALQMAESTLGKESPELIPIMNNLARTYRQLNQPASAEPIYQRVAGLSEKAHGAVHPNLAAVLSNLGQTRMELGRYKDAETAFSRALQIREKAFGIGPNHPDSAQTRIMLANAQMEQGNLAVAEAGFKKALSSLEAAGARSTAMLEAKTGLARLYKRQKKNDQAESALQDVLTTMQKSGMAPEQTDAILTEIVNLQLTQGHYARAQSGLAALAESQAQRQAPYSERVTTYEGLISIGKLQNQPQQIESALRKLLALNEKAKGARSTETLETLDRLAEILAAQGKPEARRVADQAARLRKGSKR